MNDLVDPKNSSWLSTEIQQNGHLPEKGLYIKEDDQDWGSAGMNDIKKVPK